MSIVSEDDDSDSSFVEEYNVAGDGEDSYQEWRAGLASNPTVCDYDNKAHKLFQLRIQMAITLGLSHRYKYDNIPPTLLSDPSKNIFAHPTPCGGKAFLNGYVRLMFELCHSVISNGNVISFDEMVSHTKPVWVYFDIEVKQNTNSDDVRMDSVFLSFYDFL